MHFLLGNSCRGLQSANIKLLRCISKGQCTVVTSPKQCCGISAHWKRAIDDKRKRHKKGSVSGSFPRTSKPRESMLHTCDERSHRGENFSSPVWNNVRASSPVLRIKDVRSTLKTDNGKAGPMLNAWSCSNYELGPIAIPALSCNEHKR